MEQNKTKEAPAATEAFAKVYSQEFLGGTKAKLHISMEVEDYSSSDFRELLQHIATSARQFYLFIGEKISNTP